jgi:hypothetical protein
MRNHHCNVIDSNNNRRRHHDHDSNNINDNHLYSIQPSILSQIVHILIQYLTEGTKFVTQIVSQLESTTNRRTINSSSLTKSQLPPSLSQIINGTAMNQVMKLHRFFLLRLNQIIPCILYNEHQTQTQTQSRQQQQKQIQVTCSNMNSISTILFHLLQFKGLYSMIQILAQQLGYYKTTAIGYSKNNEEKKNGSNNGTHDDDNCCAEWNELMQPLIQIIPKVEQCIEKILFQSLFLNITTKAIHEPILGICLTLDHSSYDHRQQQQYHHIDNHFTQGFWIGKLNVLLSILKLKRNKRREQINYFSSILHASDGDNWSETIATICENILFNIIPQCHGWLTIHQQQQQQESIGSPTTNDKTTIATVNTELIIDLIHVIVDCITISHPLTGSSNSKLEMRLVKWLSPLCYNQNRIKPLHQNKHPLSLELSLILIHHYIIQSLQFKTVAGVTPATTTGVFKMIRLLARLVFHQRTEIHFRINICTLLIRLCKSMSIMKLSLDQQNSWSHLTKSIEQIEGIMFHECHCFLTNILQGCVNQRVNSERKHDDNDHSDKKSSIWILFHGFEHVIDLIEWIATYQSFWRQQGTDFILDSFTNLLMMDDCDKDLGASKVSNLVIERPELLHLGIVVVSGAFICNQYKDINLSTKRLQDVLSDSILTTFSSLNVPKNNSILIPRALCHCVNSIVAMSSELVSSIMCNAMSQMLTCCLSSQTHMKNIQTSFYLPKLLSIIPLYITANVSEKTLSVRPNLFNSFSYFSSCRKNISNSKSCGYLDRLFQKAFWIYSVPNKLLFK